MVDLTPGKLLVTFTGPSGVGKDTIMSALLNEDENLNFLVTATTRDPRAGERNGEDYHFLQEADFVKRIADNDMLEHSLHHGHYYGTIASVVREMMEAGHDVIGDINYTGVAQFKTKIPQHLVSILLLPPDGKALDERLHHRARTTGESEEKIQQRLQVNAHDLANLDTPGYIFQGPDLVGSRRSDYDHVVINDDLPTAISAVQEIISTARQEK